MCCTTMLMFTRVGPYASTPAFCCDVANNPKCGPRYTVSRNITTARFVPAFGDIATMADQVQTNKTRSKQSTVFLL